MAVMLMLSLSPVLSSAKGEGHGFHGEQGRKEMTLDKKLFKKVMMIKQHQEELGVSDEQLQKIIDLKMALKKDKIKMEAEIETLKIDIHALLSKDKIDVNAVNALVDQKYETKKSISKQTVNAYAQLKDVLTVEQKEKLKDLYQKKMSHKGSFKDSGKEDWKKYKKDK
jgi:Spy/CpxP family protein refolding chaperone